MAIQILPPAEMTKVLGTELGVSDWLEIDQERINQFADCILDRQWIHVDEAAAAKGPFGKTIAHGHLSLSLVSHFSKSCMVVPEGTAMVINYGMNKVRFLTPVTVGSQIRDRIVFSAMEKKSEDRILVTTTHTIEIKGHEKPAMSAEVLTLFFTTSS